MDTNVNKVFVVLQESLFYSERWIPLGEFLEFLL